MLTMLKKLGGVVVVLGLMVGILGPMPARAVISVCTASVSPNTVTPGSTTTFSVQVTNESSTNARYLRIARPSGNFTIVSSYDIGGWTKTVSASEVTYSGGTMVEFETMIVQMSVQAANVVAASANWQVQLSDQVNGAGPTNCTGSRGTQIAGPLLSDPPVISNIAATDITQTSAKITWTTNKVATSKVYYGLTSSYGGAVNNSDLVLSHSQTLASLSAGTTYHYKVESDDGAGNIATSGDNTFTTTSPSTTQATPQPAQAAPATSADRSAPIVTITTKFDKPYPEAPSIAGTAQDNSAINRIEYSTDQGENWLPTEQITGPATKRAFGFKPQGLTEGDYRIIVRAFDQSGNEGRSGVQTLVIDRLPPKLAGISLHIGPYLIFPENSGQITIASGLDVNISSSAIGGATSIKLTATMIGSAEKTSLFTLSRTSQSGIWTGTLAVAEKGRYALTAELSDGAGNKVLQQLGQLIATDQGQVVDGSGKGANATVTLYAKDPESGLWHSQKPESLGQATAKADQNGTFNLVATPGTYYLRAEAKNKRPQVSQIFEIKETRVLSPKISMTNGFLGLVPAPLLIPKRFVLSLDTPQEKLVAKLVGSPIPDFKLATQGGEIKTALDFAGKPSVFSIGSLWTPAGRQQLAQLPKTSEANIVPIVLATSSSRIRSYLALSRIDTNVLVDQDATLVDRLGIGILPTNVFTDRRGNVKKVVVGVLSEAEFISQLNQLR